MFVATHSPPGAMQTTRFLVSSDSALELLDAALLHQAVPPSRRKLRCPALPVYPSFTWAPRNNSQSQLAPSSLCPQPISCISWRGAPPPRVSQRHRVTCQTGKCVVDHAAVDEKPCHPLVTMQSPGFQLAVERREDSTSPGGLLLALVQALPTLRSAWETMPPLSFSSAIRRLVSTSVSSTSKCGTVPSSRYTACDSSQPECTVFSQVVDH